MTEPRPFFPAKAILFGEYTVIRGGEALAIPLPNFGGSWQQNGFGKQLSLPDFSRSDAAKQAGLDVQKFQDDLKNGLFFQSNIPTGYGLGSSGAVVAAVYDRYCLEKETDLFLLKNKLGALEGFFHGKSSGIDPLISFVQESLVIGNNFAKKTSMDLLKNSLSDHCFFLLDTNKKRSAKPLIQWFAERSLDNYFIKKIEEQLLVFNKSAIESLLENDVETLFEKVHLIGDFQFRHFPPMVPAEIRSAWLDGLASDFFKLKLCGAGGGGFMLGFSKNWAATVEQLGGFSLIKI